MSSQNTARIRRFALRLAKLVIGIGVVISAGLVWASISEPRSLVGAARDADPRVRDYAASEARILGHIEANVITHTFTLRDPAVRVHSVELPGEDPPVVLIHGGGSTLLGWTPLLPYLRGRHLFLVDRPGCGLTDGFDYIDVDLRRHAVAFVGGVLDELHLSSAAFVGNSMGGLWSLWYAIDHPERVEKLALAGCPATFLGTSAPTGMRMMSLPGLGQAMMQLQPSDLNGARKGMARAAGEHAVQALDPELLAAVNLGRLIPGAMRSFRTLISTVLSPGGVNPAYAFTEADLGRVRAPMFFLWGKSDFFGAPATAERARTLHPDVSIEIVEGGHLPWLDDPERSGHAIRQFLDARLARK